jgi:hypothetical protein
MFENDMVVVGVDGNAAMNNKPGLTPGSPISRDIRNRLRQGTWHKRRACGRKAMQRFSFVLS